MFGSVFLTLACGVEPSGEDERVATVGQALYGTDVNNHNIVPGPPEVDSVVFVAGDVNCSGALVHPPTLVRSDRVLTATHCFSCGGQSVPVTFNNGTTVNGTVVCSPFRNEDVDNLPGSTEKAGAYDVAVIQLDAPVTGSAPIPVYLGSTSNNYAFGRITGPVLGAGWGATCNPLDCDTPGQGAGTLRWGLFTQFGLWYDSCDPFELLCTDIPLWFHQQEPEVQNLGVNYGQGDSGSSMFFQYRGQTVAGAVASTVVDDQFDFFGTLAAQPIATVGSVQFGSMADKQAEWLTEALGAPIEATLADMAVYGSEIVWINDRAQVLRGSGSSADAVIASGLQLWINTDTVVEGDAFAQGPAFVYNSSEVQGRVMAFSYNGADTPEEGFLDAYPRLEDLSDFAGFLDGVQFTGTQDIHLEPDQQPQVSFLAPAQYHDVTVKRGRVLQLGPGVYHMRSFWIDDQGAVELINGGPTFVYVDNVVTLRGYFGGDNTNLFIGCRDCTTIPIDYDFFATIAAPNAEIILAPGKSFVGGLYGRQVFIHQDSVMTYDPFLFDWEQPQ